MKFRPCIDIHNGKVKQIVGGSLTDRGDRAEENFVSGHDAAYYAGLYRDAGLRGGHVILLNAPGSEYYEPAREQALGALLAYPGGLQMGGGITPENAGEYLEAGASHVIVTSYVFREGRIRFDRLEDLCRKVGKQRLVLDLSCRRTDRGYAVVTDRWQRMTAEIVTLSLLERLSEYCDEFLIHAVDVEGRAEGIEEDLVRLLGDWGKRPVTYAGGVHCFEDLGLLRKLGRDRLDVTIGSALDLFGGNMPFSEVIRFIGAKKEP